MPKEKSQIEKFREAMRELGADEDSESYAAAVAKVSKAPKLTDEEIKALAKRTRATRDADSRNA
jgi:DNA-directed RNA polymerase sigma subunit (sigma70/sigma32)